MKLKKISLMTLTALYAGLGGLSAPALATSAASQLKGIDPANIKMTPTSQQTRHPTQLTPGKPGQLGVNVHRVAQGSALNRAPFEWEKDVEGIQTYIVQLEDAPAAMYQGDIPGIPATSARSLKQSRDSAAGRSVKFSPSKPGVQSYQQYLAGRQDKALSRIRAVAPQAEIKRRFNVALNGMTMELTQEQAAEVAKLPGVTAVTRAKSYKLFTDVGPKHIGADKLWAGEGVPMNLPIKGEGIIAGIIDTGINSDHPAFAAVAADGYQHVNPLGAGKFLGDCVEYQDMCNDKLIGVRSYKTITDSYKDPAFQPDANPWDVGYKRPPNGEDYNGHGSHTASTVAGNLLKNVPFKIAGNTEHSDGFDTELVFPEISGVAPRANIIAYQVCYPGDGSFGDNYGGCPGDVLVAAIEDAIKDGVDVINFSIGGLESLPWYDPIELAFLSAREAGISVAASAGNWGYWGNSLIDHVSPWLTSVAASTHGREIKPEFGSLSLSADGAPAAMKGHGVTGNFSGKLVNAADAGDELCLEPFAPGTFEADDIVICKRGENARVAKGVNVAAGGAGGIVLYNAVSWDDGTGGNSLNLNPFPIPGLHIDAASGNALVAYVAEHPDTPANLVASVVKTAEREADILADFSSRGPSRSNPDVMAPNVSAPGVDVFAAYADEMPFTQYPSPADYVAISGTSMSGPHVAGALALLTQAHPDWTPAMIQSALMMTAKPGKAWSDSYPRELREANFYEMGSGVINVERAVKAGLVLDEHGDNYRAANPEQGGDVTALNVPYFAHSSCQSSCTWMRTFTATEDGDWMVSAEALAMEGAPFLELDVYPKQFSVKAGQTQSIMVTARVLDVESVHASSANYEVFGKVNLTPTSDALPAQHLPVMARFAPSSLPTMVAGKIHRDSGTMLTPKLNSSEIKQLTVNVTGLVKGQQVEHKLSSASGKDYSFQEPETLMDNPGIKVHFFDVPEGTRRVVWEQVSETKGASTSLDIGMDLNNDGLVQWNDEAICYSFTDVQEYCTINDPTPGRYWVMVGNFKRPFGDEEDTVDTIVTSLAVIGDKDEANLDVTGPASTDGLTPYQLQLDWNLADSAKGDRFYGVVDVGNSPENPGSIGKMALNLVHDGSDVAIAASADQAKAGDTVEYKVRLAPNLLSLEREVELDIELPAGLILDETSLTAISANTDLREQIAVAGQKISLKTQQAASNASEREYRYTTSDEDESCRIPIGSNPYYLDLYKEAYIEPIGMIAGRANETFTLPLSAFGIDRIPLYNNDPDYMAKDVLSVSPGGFIQLDTLWLFWPAHYPMEAQFFPDTVIAPLWRGDGASYPEFNMDTEAFDGVSMASTNDGRYLIVEWDNMRQEFAWGINFDPDPDARYSFELLASSELNFAPGEHEFIFAYDKLTGSKGHLGSIGTHGYHGPRGTFGPAYGYLGHGYAFNDVDTKVREGLVVCANYFGPEQSEVIMTFAAKVMASAVGETQSLKVVSRYTGSDEQLDTLDVKVPSNLTMAPLADMTVAENASISFEVMVRDREHTANQIQVSGEHISAVVDGTKVTLTPDAFWFGETEVTVTASDTVFPNDAVSQRFTLTVESDGEAMATLTDVKASASVSGNSINLKSEHSVSGTQGMAGLAISWQQTSGPAVTIKDGVVSGAAPGNYGFSVTYSLNGVSKTASVNVTVPAPAPTTAPGSSDSGGSMGVFALLMLALLAAGRRLNPVRLRG
ncbi:S8 family serine peptidase [Shewanella sp. JM162201]|uniref:S8 family serine peptidase n=1 Tax=Shewanella jiangmenensis TaxID=2837387 RepID=A0ABS5V327_9GAMM|nr:S8 family serine peptidase [Shewanella jiangmenensis]MBT1444852.1 S8 family serine peptidase [Shewanella jiangmenensis]